MCKIKNILSVIHYTIYGVLCFQFAHYLCDDWDNIYPLSYIIIIKSEVWIITHCLGLAHETMVCAVCLSIFLVTMLLNLKDCMFPINKIRHVNMLVKYWVLSFSVPCFRENHDLKLCRQSEAILVYRQVTPKHKTVSWYVPDSCSIAVQCLQLVSICNASTFNNVWMCYKKGSRSKYFLLCRLLLSWSVGFVHPSVPEETVLVVWYQSDLLIIYSSVCYVTDHIYTGEIIRAVQPHSCPKVSEVTWAIFVKITWSHWERTFSCDQAALWMVLSVRLSVCHTYLTMFPSSYHHEIFRSYHQGPG